MALIDEHGNAPFGRGGRGVLDAGQGHEGNPYLMDEMALIISELGWKRKSGVREKKVTNDK